jgi:hypothetical protein
MGIMDVLSKHLECVTSIYKAEPKFWERTDNILTDSEEQQAKHQEQRDKLSVKLREEGNVYFKDGKYPEARLLFTRSISAGADGLLSTLAYANRYFKSFFKYIYIN